MPVLDRDRTRNLSFRLHKNDDGTWTVDRMAVAVLMDIRDELQKLNALLHCRNFTGIPATLRTISRKVPARKKARR